MTKHKSNNLMLSFLAMLMGTEPTISIGKMKFEHKGLVKSGITAHKPQPGHHSKVVARGFNPGTNSWK
jgi:hypothetical protein